MNMVEFYYPEEIAAFEREFVEAQQAAYMETCVEDDEIAERMDAGRKALMQRGDNEVGPYQSPMEDGMQHFHEWYRAMAHCGYAADAQRSPAATGADASPVDGAGLAVLRHHGGVREVRVGLVQQRRAGVLPRPAGHALHVAARAPAGRDAGHALPRHARLAQPGGRDLAGRLVLRHRLAAAGHRHDAELHEQRLGRGLPGGRRPARLEPAHAAPRHCRGKARWCSRVLAGFAGVVMMLRPTIEQNQVFAGLIGLMSGLTAAFAYMQVMALGKLGEPESRTVFYFAARLGRGRRRRHGW